jgi:hypothetical protein
MKIAKKYLLLASTILSLSSANALACAQGCGVFNVGTSSLIPNEEGGIAFLQYDYNSQTRNWHGENSSTNDNHDTRIETQTITAGAQYMFNRDWGLAARVPYVTRLVNEIHEEDHGMMGSMTTLSSHRNSEIGDIRLNGIYSGISDDMSTGLTFGVKLPTGSTNAKSFNINNQIGTGSTDLLLGAYHLGKVNNVKNLTYFAQTSLDQPVFYKEGYKPGYEVSGGVGTSYNLGSVFGLKKFAPIAQFTANHKGKDSGSLSHHNLDSGYSQVFFNPAIEIGLGEYRLYADVGLPVYQRVNGTQLVSKNSFKVIVGRSF